MIEPSWADGDRVQKLKFLTPDFIKIGDICRDSKTNSPEKKFLIVSIRSHSCDDPRAPTFKGQICMAEARDLADPKNLFVHENFSLYSFRLGSHNSTGDYEPDAKLRESFLAHWVPIVDAIPQDRHYQEAIGRIGYYVIDVNTEKIVAHFPHMDSFEGAPKILSERYKLYQDLLRRVPELKTLPESKFKTGSQIDSNAPEYKEVFEAVHGSL